MSTTPSGFILALLLASSASAQSVFVVAPQPGPGVFSTDIQPAIDAAADGNLVLVKAGAYTGFTIDGKGVSVVADAGASVIVDGHVLVTHVAASQRALLQGLTVHGDNAISPAIATSDLPGALWIESCSVIGGTANGTGQVGVSINTSPSVVIQRSVMQGGDGASGGTITMGAPGLHVAVSTVDVGDSQCIGGHGAPPLTGSFQGFGGSGLRVLPGCFVFASGTSFQGGDGAGAGPHGFTGGAGGAGINIESPVVLLECTTAGGLGQGGAPDGAATVVIGAGSIQTIDDVARHFSTTSPVREGQSTTIAFGGVPGEIVGLWFSPAPAPPKLLLAFEGMFALSAVGLQGFVLGAIPAGGTLSMPVVVPTLPAALQSVTVWCQSTFDGPLTHAVISPTSALVLLDASL